MKLEIENRISSKWCYELLKDIKVDMKQLLTEAEELRKKFVPVKEFDAEKGAGFGATKMMDRQTLTGWTVRRFMAG